jgi:hypothetical protein
VRFAILIALAAWGGAVAECARADDIFIHIVLGSRDGYIVPEDYATAYQADLLATLPSAVKCDGFWTPPEQDVAVADRALRDMIHAAAKDPTVLFPELAPSRDPDAKQSDDDKRELARERIELALISENYDSYARQFVGIIIDGQKLVLCNYSDGTKLNPAAGYIFIQKTFVADGTVHFLQCRFEPWLKNITNVSIIGSWQAPAK